MQSVEVRLPTQKLSRGLVSIREWLDDRGFEPSTFRYDTISDGSEVVVHVTFKIDEEAVAFAEELGGVFIST